MQWFASRPVWIGAGTLAILLIVIAVLLPRPAAQTALPIAFDESAKLSACRAETLKLVKPEKVDIALLTQISSFCYGQVRGEELLGDFNIRRTNYLRQQFQGIVFLWMLVVITVSGVMLAAVQLFAAYKLASTGRGNFDQGGEVALEEKRLSVKSSVTGLLILTVSFAFFMVFVVWVYPLTESKITPEGQTLAAPLPTLGVGGLGRAPQPSPAAPAEK